MREVRRRPVSASNHTARAPRQRAATIPACYRKSQSEFRFLLDSNSFDPPRGQRLIRYDKPHTHRNPRATLLAHAFTCHAADVLALDEKRRPLLCHRHTVGIARRKPAEGRSPARGRESHAFYPREVVAKMRVYTIENIRRLLQHGVLTRLEMRIGTKQRDARRSADHVRSWPCDGSPRQRDKHYSSVTSRRMTSSSCPGPNFAPRCAAQFRSASANRLWRKTFSCQPRVA
jgi:hypothetical protein